MRVEFITLRGINLGGISMKIDLLSGGVIALILLSFLQGCGRPEDAGSDVKYLTPSSYNCATAPAERIAKVRSYGNFVRGWSGQQMEIAINNVALIPDRDINHLLWTYQSGASSGIHSSFTFFGVAGVTSLRGGTTKNGFRGMIATAVTAGTNQVMFALQHEIGHGVKIVAAEAAQNTEYSDFEGSIRKVWSELMSKGGMIRGYAKSKPDESWAEAYANFYCSPESNRFIEANLPYTNKFLRTVLEPPIWEQSGHQPAATGNGQPIGDGTDGEHQPPIIEDEPTGVPASASVPATGTGTTETPRPSGFLDFIRQLIAKFFGGRNGN
jgi:hypothetical protein